MTVDNMPLMDFERDCTVDECSSSDVLFSLDSIARGLGAKKKYSSDGRSDYERSVWNLDGQILITNEFKRVSDSNSIYITRIRSLSGCSIDGVRDRFDAFFEKKSGYLEKD